MPDDPIAAAGAETAAARPTADVSVVIPAYGDCPHLPAVLAALGRQTVRPREILVIHTGDHDPTAALAGCDPLLTVIHQDQRLFAGAARNIGIDRAAGAWIAFLDADVIPVDHWLEALLEAAEAAPDRFVVGSVGYARTGGYWGLSLWAIEFSSVHPYMPDREMQGGASANMLVPAEAARAVGGFPGAFAAAEDVVFGAKLRQSGLTNWFSSRAQVKHLNIEGFQHFRRHLLWLGLWSRTARSHGSAEAKTLMFHWPQITLLWLGRLTLTVGRTLRCGSGLRPRLAAHLPGIVCGLIIWNIGFVQKSHARKPTTTHHKPESRRTLK